MTQGTDTTKAEGDVFSLRVLESIDQIAPTTWDGLAAVSPPEPAGDESDASSPGGNPFLLHAFLKSLEDSGSVSARAGWMPQHLVLETASGQILAAMPAYLKSHSQGEYVFDHGWADALERAGGSYYPKLQISVPFTPATGPRLLVGYSAGAEVRRLALCQGIKAYVGQTGISSAHATFLTPADIEAMEDGEFLHRIDQQFHFQNRGYGTYEDFLETLASRKRKGLRKERREALSAGITVDWLTGKDLTEAAWDAFYGFYMDTGSRKWGRPYLNRKFFSLISERMPERIVLMMAKREGRYIAGALNFVGGGVLYGRYWGCTEDHPFLHFELCYHQAIDYAIEHKLAVVEAGAQGEHKLARGYEPVTTHSAHYIRHPGLRQAIENHLEVERRQVAAMQAMLGEHTPFKKHEDGSPAHAPPEPQRPDQAEQD